MTVISTTRHRKQPEWKAIVRRYQTPTVRQSIWQVANSFGLLFVFWVIMYLSLNISYWLTLALALPTAGFLVRIFIIQHDCGHGSFFKSRTWNDRLGLVCGIFTLTPYYQWRKSHAIHHATSSNLGKRGVQDVYTMTVREYLASSKVERLKYRLYRNPITLFLIIPMTLFVVLYRFPSPFSKRKEKMSVIITDLFLITIVALISWLIGFRTFLMLYLPVVFIATTVGTWLFFVQHQFEDTYWADEDEWSYDEAALKGSSYYKLPKVLQWFTGNIGFHHIHHLSPKIPNYRLEQCHKENPLFQEVTVLTPATSISTTFLSLWDEENKKLISFRKLKKRQKMEASYSS